MDALVELRKNIDQMLTAKLATAKKELQDKLSYLDGLFGASAKGGRGVRGRKVEAKYRGPDGETWAGRGMRPRWLTALVEAGHKLEEFEIAPGAARRKTAAAKKPGRKAKGKRGRPKAAAAAAE
ncbi:MAG: H-NS histone family protein [Variibacter sp.]|nr:H-NS histone family protein [Variibacter sp.]